MAIQEECIEKTRGGEETMGCNIRSIDKGIQEGENKTTKLQE